MAEPFADDSPPLHTGVNQNPEQGRDAAKETSLDDTPKEEFEDRIRGMLQRGNLEHGNLQRRNQPQMMINPLKPEVSMGKGGTTSALPPMKTGDQGSSPKSREVLNKSSGAPRKKRLRQTQQKKGINKGQDTSENGSNMPGEIDNISPLSSAMSLDTQRQLRSNIDHRPRSPKSEVGTVLHPDHRPIALPQTSTSIPRNLQMSSRHANSNGISHMQYMQRRAEGVREESSHGSAIDSTAGRPYQRKIDDPGHRFSPGPSHFVPQANSGYPNFAQRPQPQYRNFLAPTGYSQLPRDHEYYISPVRMQADYIGRVASTVVADSEPSVQSLRAMEKLRTDLEGLVRSVVSAHEEVSNPNLDPYSIRLKCFGSLSSGFATKDSDMDLTFISPQSKPDPASPESEIPRILEKLLLDSGYGARLLTRTRVPIIKFCEKPTASLSKNLKEERAKWENSLEQPQQTEPVSKKKRTRKKRSTKAALTKAESDLEKGSSGLLHYSSTDSTSQQDSLQSKHVVSTTYSSVTGQQTEARVKAGAEETGNGGANQGSEEPVCKAGARVQPVRSDDELVRLYFLAIREAWFNDDERKIIYRFAEMVNKTKTSQDRSGLDQARLDLRTLPDVLSRYREITEKDKHLDFPKIGVGIQCDINFSNHLGIHNTLLLRCYSHCDPRIRPMVLFVKAWAKRRKINSPYHGTLSSYGYVLMVLHYAVNIASPPLAPNLQLEWNQRHVGSIGETTCDGYDVRFWRSEKDIRLAAARGRITANRETLGSLLRGFFQYFAQEGRHIFGGGFSWSTKVLSLRTHGGLLSKQEKGWTGARTETIEPSAPGQEVKEVKHRYLFAIEDPFEIDHNIARPVAHHGIVAIRDEFRRAHRIIQCCGQNNGVSVDLLAEGKEHVQERTFFGPNPARYQKPKPFVPANLAVDNTDNGTGQSTGLKKSNGRLNENDKLQPNLGSRPEEAVVANSSTSTATIRKPQDDSSQQSVQGRALVSQIKATTNFRFLQTKRTVEVVNINGGDPDFVQYPEGAMPAEDMESGGDDQGNLSRLEDEHKVRALRLDNEAHVEALKLEDDDNGSVVHVDGPGLEVMENSEHIGEAQVDDVVGGRLEVVEDAESKKIAGNMDVASRGLGVVGDTKDTKAAEVVGVRDGELEAVAGGEDKRDVEIVGVSGTELEIETDQEGGRPIEAIEIGAEDMGMDPRNGNQKSSSEHGQLLSNANGEEA